jgi:hypothetical protein
VSALHLSSDSPRGDAILHRTNGNLLFVFGSVPPDSFPDFLPGLDLPLLGGPGFLGIMMGSKSRSCAINSQ